MSTWNQIAKEGQQREGLGIESFPERSAASVPSPRRSWGPAVLGESFAQSSVFKEASQIYCM